MLPTFHAANTGETPVPQSTNQCPVPDFEFSDIQRIAPPWHGRPAHVSCLQFKKPSRYQMLPTLHAANTGETPVPQSTNQCPVPDFEFSDVQRVAPWHGRPAHVSCADFKKNLDIKCYLHSTQPTRARRPCHKAPISVQCQTFSSAILKGLL